MKRTYIAIDLKSFYASVECVRRNLNPMTENLVVADSTRTEKTICLAVSPSLKSYGISGRARLFEVIQKVKEINLMRKRYAPNRKFIGKSTNYIELKNNPALELSYVVAPPQMAYYMEVSTKIYKIYLRYIAPEDIHVYSIDEVFMDVTSYLKMYNLSARELAMKIILETLAETGITATAGIGTNLYLCKIAMDVMAKHIPADKNGVRIAELDEVSYRHKLWTHQPITNFWRVGKGYATKLKKLGIHTMGDLALFSISQQGEDTLYKIFGVNAELLIDHAWGFESCTIKDIKEHKTTNQSISSGQVLQNPYDFNKAKLVVREMTELLVLDLVEKRLVTNQMVLTIGYDIENLKDKTRRNSYKGEITTDRYGRKVPKHAHGTINLDRQTSSTKLIVTAVMQLFDRIVDKNLLIRRMYIVAANVINEDIVATKQIAVQYNLFSDVAEEQQRIAKDLRKEKDLQQAVLALKKKFGKNTILKGINFQEGATAIERNKQIGGHKA